MEKIDGLLFIDIDLFVISYFLKLWFKVQFVEWEKYNQENLVNLVKNLQETACVEVRLHTQYFVKNRKIRKNMKDRRCIGKEYVVDLLYFHFYGCLCGWTATISR